MLRIIVNILGQTEDFFTLFYMRKYLQRGRGHYEFSDSTNDKIQNGIRSLTPNLNYLDIPPFFHDRLERMAADSDVNLGVGTPKDSLPAEVYCSNLSGGHSMCSRASSDMTVVCTEYMREFLVWLDAPQHKGKGR
jgi:hypothetical protein